MTNRIMRLSKSCLSDAEKKAVMEVLDHEFLGMGTEVYQFEEMLTGFFSRPAVCVSTGTAALHLALQAADIGVGDEVLVQSLTYLASFQAISATGAVPVACDVDADTLCLDWKDAEKRLTTKTKAVMPVHYAGSAGALDEVYAFAEQHNLRVIEDAAHAFGTVCQGQKIGSFGDIACFSFDGIKNITSGEGGCIVTDDAEILKKVRDARLLGVEKDTEKRFAGERSWSFGVDAQGWRYHMSNIMAAIGIQQLNRFEYLANKRRLLANKYDEILEGTSIKCFSNDYSQSVPHIYAIILPVNNGNERDLIRRKMNESGIETGIHYYPNHFLDYFYAEEVERLEVTEYMYEHLLTLPLHPDLTENDVECVCNELISLL